MFDGDIKQYSLTSCERIVKTITPDNKLIILKDQIKLCSASSGIHLLLNINNGDLQ